MIMNLKKGDLLALSKVLSPDLGFLYMAEQASPDENKVTNLYYNDKASILYVEFDTILQTFRCMNRNHRCYLGPNLAEALKAERIVSMLADNAWFGEMDHPQDIATGVKLTPQRVQTIDMNNRSHKIMKPVVNGDVMTGRIQTTAATEAGRGFAIEILQGLIPAFSCRAIATLQTIDGKPTVIVRKLITYDWVLYPSHKEAHIQGTPQFIQKNAAITALESGGICQSSVFKRFGKFTEDVQIPVTEILAYAGQKDPNMQTIMESFDLDMNDLVGFDPTMEHVMVKDHDNTIFVKMSPNTKKEVRNFLSSF